MAFMERLAVCMACKQAVGSVNCTLCGALVCAACFDRKKGVCAFCAQGKRV